MPSAAPAAEGPVYGTPARSRTACRVPSSPGPPWHALTTALTGNVVRLVKRVPARTKPPPGPATSSRGSDLGGTPLANAAASSVGLTA